VIYLSNFLLLIINKGKTTILNRMLNNLEGKRIVVIVNDMSEVNIDAALIKRTDEKMIEMSNGCICCTLREDLLEQLVQLGNDSSNIDYIIIECSGIAEPVHVAETFSYADTIGKNLSSTVRLDTMVTVVDMQSFFVHFADSTTINTTCNEENNKSEERTLSHLLIDQIQFADVIILNKTDTVSRSILRKIKAVVKDLNPHAKVMTSSYGNEIPIDSMLGTNLFSFEKASQNSQWFAEEWGTALTPETEEYGISSITFRGDPSNRRPFHSERLKMFFDNMTISSTNTGHNTLVRCKGFIWLANHHNNFVLLHQTGGALNMQIGGKWWVDIDKSLWPDDADFRSEVQTKIKNSKKLGNDFGDRGHTLVLIGLHMDKAKVLSALNACLLTDEELTMGPVEWSKFPDSFTYSNKASMEGIGNASSSNSLKSENENASIQDSNLPKEENPKKRRRGGRTQKI
jgi:G3E family GTPase